MNRQNQHDEQSNSKVSRFMQQHDEQRKPVFANAEQQKQWEEDYMWGEWHKAKTQRQQENA